MEDEKVKNLAETLKKGHLAASMSEAIEKAKSILGATIAKTDTSEEKQPDAPPKPNYDITKETVTLNELMNELNVNTEQLAAQEQRKVADIRAEVNEIKEEIKEAEKNPEKMEQIKEGIEKVKDKMNEIEETKTEAKENKTEQEDMFKEEKKIDLTKVFNYKK